MWEVSSKISVLRSEIFEETYLLSLHFSWFCSFIADFIAGQSIILFIHFLLLLFLFVTHLFSLVNHWFLLFTCCLSIFAFHLPLIYFCFSLVAHLWKILLVHSHLIYLLACCSSIKETQVLNASFTHYFARNFKAQTSLLLQKELNQTMLSGSKKVGPTLKMFVI